MLSYIVLFVVDVIFYLINIFINLKQNNIKLQDLWEDDEVKKSRARKGSILRGRDGREVKKGVY